MKGDNQIRAARSLCEKGAWAELLAFTERWQSADPADARALFYRGAALAGAGRFAEAETVYRRAIEMDPRHFKAWNNLAAILFDALNRPAEAIRCMEQAMKIEPQNKLGWANLASMAGRLGRHDKALEFAEQALTLDPRMVEAQLHKAAAAKALGKPEILKEVSETLSTLRAEQFHRAR